MIDVNHESGKINNLKCGAKVECNVGILLIVRKKLIDVLLKYFGERI